MGLLHMEKKTITVEMGGTTKIIPETALPKLQETANEMHNLAIRGGFTKEMADKMFTLRIVKEEI